MKAKEKASELFELFYDDRLRASLRGKIKNSKYLALKCVDEILINQHDLIPLSVATYWEEVKQEIQKL